MTSQEQKLLVEAAIPLEVLCAQIRCKLYREMTPDFQVKLLTSLDTIKGLLSNKIKPDLAVAAKAMLIALSCYGPTIGDLFGHDEQFMDAFQAIKEVFEGEP